MRKNIKISLVILVFLISAGLFVASSSHAYINYETGKRSGSNCAACHPGFQGGFGSPLHDLHLGLTFTCDLCHLEIAGDIPRTAVSAINNDNIDGQGCRGCHGRAEDGEMDAKGWAAGLRQFHWGTGIRNCPGCHSDSDPSNYTPVGEDVLPPYYTRNDVSIISSCDDGLDNDGDGIRDCDDLDCTDDPVCQLPETNCTDGVDNDGDGATDCDDNDCTVDPACLPETNCTDGVDNDGDGATDCDDIDCANDLACVAGCQSDADCNDGVSCTDDACDVVTGECSNVADDRLCDNLDFCDGVETCDPVNDCQAGTPPCLAGEICDEVTDTCEPIITDCQSDADCADTDFCNGDETCVAGTCVAGSDPCVAGETCNEGTDSCDVTECVAEVCDNGVDDDGDPYVDCEDQNCFNDPACMPDTETSCTDGVDNDGDGVIDCGDSDCANDAACLPDTETSCTDGMDNDNDGKVDCNDSDCSAAPECQPFCGDGNIDPGEQCDDGNTADGDGCSSKCTIETSDDDDDSDDRDSRKRWRRSWRR
jgi:hypothetical protein